MNLTLAQSIAACHYIALMPWEVSICIMKYCYCVAIRIDIENARNGLNCATIILLPGAGPQWFWRRRQRINSRYDFPSSALCYFTTEPKAMDAEGEGLSPLVPVCTLEKKTYATSPLEEALLLSIFRKFVSEYTQMPLRADIPGIQGLVAQGRSYRVLTPIQQ